MLVSCGNDSFNKYDRLVVPLRLVVLSHKVVQPTNRCQFSWVVVSTSTPRPHSSCIFPIAPVADQLLMPDSVTARKDDVSAADQAAMANVAG